jgi:hypothetical protein
MEDGPIDKDNSTNSYIVINALPVLDGDGVGPQNGIMNINIYYPKFHGNYDQDSLDSIVKAVLQLLNDYSEQDSGLHFQFEIDTQDVKKDPDRPNYVYANIRLEYAAERYYEVDE